MDPSLVLSRPGATALNSFLRLTRQGTRIQVTIRRLLPGVGHGIPGVLLRPAGIVLLGVLLALGDVLGGQWELRAGVGRVGHVRLLSSRQ
jgi:hypothetical protein